MFQLYKDEKLPKVICEICHKLLVQYSEFKNTCITSQNALLGLKKSVKNESTEADTSWDDDNDYGNLYIDKNEKEEKRHNDYQNFVVKVEKLHPEYNGKSQLTKSQKVNSVKVSQASINNIVDQRSQVEETVRHVKTILLSIFCI